jgi:hypothetical protein
MEYPKDWYKYLEKGDIVESINTSHESTRIRRPVGTQLLIVKVDCLSHRFWYNSCLHKSRCSSSAFNEFKPIKMKAFPQPQEDNYEIF